MADSDEEIRRRILADQGGYPAAGDVTRYEPTGTGADYPALSQDKTVPAAPTGSPQSLADSSDKLALATTSEQRQSTLAASLSSAAPALAPAQDFERTSYAPINLPQDFERASYTSDSEAPKPLALPQEFQRTSYTPVADQSDVRRAQLVNVPSDTTPGAPLQLPSDEAYSASAALSGPTPRAELLKLPEGVGAYVAPPAITSQASTSARADLVKLPDVNYPAPPGSAGTEEVRATQPPLMPAGARAPGSPGGPTVLALPSEFQAPEVRRAELVKLPAQAQPVPRALSVSPGTVVKQAAPAPQEGVAPRALPVSSAQPIRQATTPSLAESRTRFQTELQDPKVMGLLMASTQAEVGSQGAGAQQAYVESVMNRASAENRSLSSVLTDTHYYPPETINSLGQIPGGRTAKNYQGIIGSVLGGSNISNMATGNESGNVHSGGAPVMFSAGGERFVRENWTKDWRGGPSTPGVATTTTTAPGTTTTAPSGGSDLDAKINALISAKNEVVMPKDENVDPKDTFAVASQQAMKLAKAMQDKGVPINREQLGTMISSQYSALVSQQVEQAKETREHQWEIQKASVVPQRLGAAESDQLAGANAIFGQLDNLMNLHAGVSKAGHANWASAGSNLLRSTSPDMIAFDSGRAALFTPTAKAVLGNTGNLSELEQKMPEKMLPDVGDNPLIAKGKADQVKLQIANMTINKIEGYAHSGYDVSGWMPLYKQMTDYRDAQANKVAAAPGVNTQAKTAATQSSAQKLKDMDKGLHQ